MLARPGKSLVFDANRVVKRLETMEDRSQRVDGSSSLCSRVPERFRALYLVFAAMDEDSRKRTDELDFLKAFEDFYLAMAYQIHYSQVLHRLATSQRVVQEVYQAHSRIDAIYEQLGAVEGPEQSSDWRRCWTGDREKQERWFSRELASLDDDEFLKARIKDINNPDKLTKVLAIMATQRQVRTSRASGDTNDIDLTASPAILKLFERAQNRIEKLHGVCMPHDLYDWYIEKEDVVLGSAVQVEEGTFGVLYRGTWNDVYAKPPKFHDSVALKRLDSQLDIPANDVSFSRELSVWTRINHPNILKMYGANHISRPRFFVCEFADGGNLLDFFNKPEKQHRDQFWNKFGQAAIGLAYLHSENIEHGGLKCHNILITADGVVKLADFGLATVRVQSVSISQRAERDQTRWKAPEQLRQTATPVDFKKADVYSLGLCIIEAATGSIPFGMDADEEVIDKKLNGVSVDRPDDAFSDDEWKLVSRMVDHDPTNRPTAKELMHLMSRQQPVDHCVDCAYLNPTSCQHCDHCGIRLAAVA